MKKYILRELGKLKSQGGQVLPLVLIMLVIGALFLVPSVSYVATHVRTGEVLEKHVRGMYAAQAGIEDAISKIKAGSIVTPYTLSNPVNNMSVNYEINTITDFEGEKVGVHWDWLTVNKTNVPSGDGTYTYTVTFQVCADSANDKNIKIEMIWLALPQGLHYIGPTTGDIPLTDDELTITGDPTTGEYLQWDLKHDTYSMQAKKGTCVQASIQLILDVAEGFEGTDFTDMTGFSVIKVLSSDIGYIFDSIPYAITSKAYQDGVLVATIECGILKAQDGSISTEYWQLSP
jgi:hypothetical protein